MKRMVVGGQSDGLREGGERGRRGRGRREKTCIALSHKKGRYVHAGLLFLPRELPVKKWKRMGRERERRNWKQSKK